MTLLRIFDQTLTTSKLILSKLLKEPKVKYSFFTNGGSELIEQLEDSYNFFHYFNFSNNSCIHVFQINDTNIMLRINSKNIKKIIAKLK